MPPARAIVLGIVLLVATLAASQWLDDTRLAEGMLRADHRLPELMPSYIPDLRRAVQLTLATVVAVPLLAFLAWIGETAFARPTGPGQVARGWRLATWVVICVLTGLCVYGLVDYETLGGLDSVDARFANQAALVLAAVAAALFWAFCLLGTERMIRPAVPCGGLLVGRR